MDNKIKFRLGHYKEAKVLKNETDGITLDLPQMDEQELLDLLPPVSIVTITYNRGMFASLMLYNWMQIKYPRDKLEWVIVDDSDSDEYPLVDYIPQDDPYIRYIKLDKWLPIAEKRNKAVELAKYEFIVHMDDDDYYFPDSVLAKIRVLLHYNMQGVHSMPFGIYDMMKNMSVLYEPERESNHVAEATLAYRKDYWRAHPFRSDEKLGSNEGKGFIGRNFNKWIKIHFLFNMVSITHSTNFTGDTRRFEHNINVQTGSFKNVFTPEFNRLLDNVKKILDVKKLNK